MSDYATSPQEVPSAIVSAVVEDWSREAKPTFSWDPPRSLIASLRAYQRLAPSPYPWHQLAKKWAVLRHMFWSAVTGADIPLNCKIAGGLLLPHPNGVVLHPDAEIGPNCLIFQQVTIASAEGGAPRIAGHVDIGAGAKLLGPIRIGEHARIGANAVVIDHVASGCTVGGIPAKVLSSRRQRTSPQGS